MNDFRNGELSRSICETYRVLESTLNVADVVLLLHHESGGHASPPRLTRMA